MKGISFGLILLVILGFAFNGAAADRVKLCDGLNMQAASMDMDDNRLVWADEARQAIGVYTFSSGQAESKKISVRPRAVRLAGFSAYFLGPEGFPYSLDLKTFKVSQLDTVPAEGIAANDKYIVWYNADRVIVHELRRGQRTEYKAGQVIKGVSVSGEMLAYIDGVNNERDLLTIVNLGNGQLHSYAFQRVTGLASAYPMVAVQSSRGNGDSKLQLVNVETEHLMTLKKVQYQANPDMAEQVIAFQAQTPDADRTPGTSGIYIYEIDQDRLTLLSHDGTNPVISGNHVAWLENGGIWVAKYR